MLPKTLNMKHQEGVNLLFLLRMGGGSAWESNPPAEVLARHTGFEVLKKTCKFNSLRLGAMDLQCHHPFPSSIFLLVRQGHGSVIHLFARLSQVFRRHICVDHC